MLIKEYVRPTGEIVMFHWYKNRTVCITIDGDATSTHTLKDAHYYTALSFARAWTLEDMHTYSTLGN